MACSLSALASWRDVFNGDWAMWALWSVVECYQTNWAQNQEDTESWRLVVRSHSSWRNGGLSWYVLYESFSSCTICVPSRSCRMDCMRFHKPTTSDHFLSYPNILLHLWVALGISTWCCRSAHTHMVKNCNGLYVLKSQFIGSYVFTCRACN